MNQESSISLYFRLISKEIKQFIDKRLDNNLTNIHISILCYIKRNNNTNVYQKDIEDFLNIRRSTTTEILNVMEKNNLIKRVDSSLDKRKKIIVLSQKGNIYVKKFKEILEDVEKILFLKISEEEQKQLVHILYKIRKNIINSQEEIC